MPLLYQQGTQEGSARACGAQREVLKKSEPPGQVLLPSSVGAELMRQDAPKNGAQLFELRSAAGAVTHAGVLDFTAAEGSIAVPAHVLRNLALVAHRSDPSAAATPAEAPGVSLPWASDLDAAMHAGNGVADERGGGAGEAGASGLPRITVTYRKLPKGARLLEWPCQFAGAGRVQSGFVHGRPLQ